MKKKGILVTSINETEAPFADFVVDAIFIID